MKLWPWIPSRRPIRLSEALRAMMKDKNYNLTARTFAIAAGVTRLSIKDWINGIHLPSDIELKAIAGAFCLNRFGFVTTKERNKIFEELKIIANIDRLNRSNQ
jgi:transcriptional regulator with XRE-family HTH domain